MNFLLHFALSKCVCFLVFLRCLCQNSAGRQKLPWLYPAGEMVSWFQHAGNTSLACKCSKIPSWLFADTRQKVLLLWVSSPHLCCGCNSCVSRKVFSSGLRRAQISVCRVTILYIYCINAKYLILYIYMLNSSRCSWVLKGAQKCKSLTSSSSLVDQETQCHHFASYVWRSCSQVL